MAKKFEDFTKIYPVVKTIRTKLIPVSSSLEKCDMDDFLKECDYTNKNNEWYNYITDDENRSNDSQRVKELIDLYHKYFINETLSNFKNLDKEFVEAKNKHPYWEELLSLFYQVYTDTSKSDEDKVKSQDNLRERIASVFELNKDFKEIFKSKMLKEILAPFLKNNNFPDEDLKLVNSFKDFTTYFSTFQTNRKNIYSSEAKSTAISFRIVNDNLPKFIVNMHTYAKVSVNPDLLVFLNEANKNFRSQLETLMVSKIDDIFTLNTFTNVLAQSQIDAYNAIIGGKVEGSHVRGINQFINEYNQEHKEKKLPYFMVLYKQILSDRTPVSWLPQKFEDDQELLSAIEKSYQDLCKKIAAGDVLSRILSSLSEYNSSGIYITNDKLLSQISKSMFGDSGFIAKAIEDYEIGKAERKDSNKVDYGKISKALSDKGSFSIAQIDESIAGKIRDTDDDDLKNARFQTIESYFANLKISESADGERTDVISAISHAYNNLTIKELLQNYSNEEKHNALCLDKESKILIKDYLDKVLNLLHFINPLMGKGDECDKDETFYGEFVPVWDELNKFIPLYNMVRNYLTRKPYNEEKIQLFFGNNGKFLSGWPDSKTEKSDNGTQYGGYLFRKKNAIGEYDYYLGVSTNKKLFRRKDMVDSSDFIERIDYYQLKSQTFYGNSYVGKYSDDEKKIKDAIGNYVVLKDLSKEYSFKKDETVCSYLKRVKNMDRISYHDIINNPQVSEAYNELKSHILMTLANCTRVDKALEILCHKEYDLIRIYEEIQSLLPFVSFSYYKVSMDDVEKAMCANGGRLFLFKITNKDLSYADSFAQGQRKSRGKENLHTMYLKALLNGNVNFDIGTGSIYFRRKTDFGYTDKTWNKGHHYEELKDRFSYPIISKRRYAVDHLQFHLSMTINFKADNKGYINDMVNETICNGGFKHIIGIDRGERNLLYVSVIDLRGNIIEQRSLNEITSECNIVHTTNYHHLLNDREIKRQEERKSWDSIEKIKDLKNGYVSQAVHEIAKLVLKYHAIVVLEDLNLKGFIRSRQKIEKSVYQQFEKQLIEKLNYLVDKRVEDGNPGSSTNGYQLTNSIDKKGKQSGILFYIPAWNTSKIDPTTGFVNLFDLRYHDKDKASEFFERFKNIEYNSDKNWFELSFDYKHGLTTKNAGVKTNWTICTYGSRIENFKNSVNKWNTRHVESLTEKWKEFFRENDVDIYANLKKQIVQKNNAEFYKRLLGLLRLTLQLRNSDKNNDYIISPVMNEDGDFYDSRSQDKAQPLDADANGAYNIARKGLMWVRQMKEHRGKKNFVPKLGNNDWLNFAQQKPYKDE